MCRHLLNPDSRRFDYLGLGVCARNSCFVTTEKVASTFKELLYNGMVAIEGRMDHVSDDTFVLEELVRTVVGFMGWTCGRAGGLGAESAQARC